MKPETLADIKIWMARHPKQNKVCGGAFGNLMGYYNSFPTATWDFTEDFSACTTNQCDGLWPSDNTTHVSVDTTNDYLVVTCSTSNRFNLIYYDFGASYISDTAFVMRMSVDITSHTGATTAGNVSKFMVLLGDTTSKNEDPTGDNFGFTVRYDTLQGSNIWEGKYSNNGSTTNVSTNRSVSAEKIYTETIRTSATTGTFKLFSDSGYSTQVGSTASLTPASTIQSLRYLKVILFVQQTNSAITAHIDDIQIMKSVSTPP